ncbi:MAG TPA: hypothetical protein VMB05_07455 [Solirubrobacteraceae bacterium]|nr:hypothetical protein [Solirubrobacteraceae bacterium]HUB74486.1 hypothetical protein [Solirubrobacteraceae bacterium]
MSAKPIPKTRKWSARSRETWAGWWANPVSKQWESDHIAAAERLIEQINDVEGLVHQRERRLQERDIKQQERVLGLRVPLKVEVDEPPPTPPEPRDIPLRVPDLSLMHLGERAVFVHPHDLEGPSLGPLVVQHIERWYCFGPGPLRGSPARVSDEQLALIHCMYLLNDDGSRRFPEVDIVWRKGTGKSTTVGWIALTELDPEGPVRFDGWNDDGSPRGRPVIDPYIPLLAFTEGQASTVTFRAVLAMAKGALNSQNFRITDNWISRADDTGLLEPVSGSPSARDGSMNTSFTSADELHRLTSDRLHETVSVMQQNRMKVPDSWQLGTTTSWASGDGSLAEVEDERARTKKPSGLLYIWRGADPAKWDLTTREGAEGALEEASPPGMPKGHGVVEQWEAVKDDPVKLRYWARVWCGIPSEGEASMDRPAFPDGLREHTPGVGPRTPVALGLAREGQGGVIAATMLVGSGAGWVVGRYSTVTELERALRSIITANPRPRAFTVEAVQLNRGRWLPYANRWVGDRDLNRGKKLLEHKPREEPEIVARYLEAAPPVWCRDDAARERLLSTRIVDLDDEKIAVTTATADFWALAFSYDAAQTAIRQGKVKTGEVVMF